ncbi:hypothetical protein T265_00544 [Opisthorchis viverrini]|uniref:Uncharacterized protein n=1 Tax=Opisthorchis viverrini TaxID=6198 RepID=A0A075A1U4_OPIVI|nr:hypothetical protein T265_00544 [Opisthorchis viverrini]KER33658.1 hypothetical protein T265_00544 [Opisthorchis viverrini]
MTKQIGSSLGGGVSRAQNNTARVPQKGIRSNSFLCQTLIVCFRIRAFASYTILGSTVPANYVTPNTRRPHTILYGTADFRKARTDCSNDQPTPVTSLGSFLPLCIV